MEYQKNSITLIFPHQLFEKHPAIQSGAAIYLLEDYLSFRIHPFHKQRLVLLRAAMQSYKQQLQNKGHEVVYIESKQLRTRNALSTLIEKIHPSKLHVVYPTDSWLLSDLKTVSTKIQAELVIYSSPMFLTPLDDLFSFFKEKKHFSMGPFYTYQRKKLNLLMHHLKPIGGKFSFDTENRKKLPKNTRLPTLETPKETVEIKKATAYVEETFPDAIGHVDPFLYPYTSKESKKWLKKFIDQRLPQFGDYEDAIDADASFIFHSVLSPILNIGLITPEEVIQSALEAYEKGLVAINSVEGFLRQIIGWREFIRGCYVIKGTEQRTSNVFKHRKPIPYKFWKGQTGIDPIDQTIKKILKTGYCHHIERLMILGNFLLLCECDPNEVYQWFMEHFVDAYDWVMVPNIYGMSQYADGGVMTTKPYISGANYILKMSNYPKGTWVPIWDGLFWQFIEKHKKLFSENPRTKPLISLFKKNEKTTQAKIKIANEWLTSFHQR